MVPMGSDLNRAEAHVRAVLSPAFARVGLGGALLVHAPPGGGRTCFAKALCARVRAPASAAEPAPHTTLISCALLARAPPARALAALRAALRRASARAPSLVVLDDLHRLAPAEVDGSAAAAAAAAGALPTAVEAARGAQAAELLADWLRGDAHGTPSTVGAAAGLRSWDEDSGPALVLSLGERAPAVAVVATCCSPGSATLHAALSAPAIFGAELALPAVTAHDRARMLASVLGAHGATTAASSAATIGAHLHALGASRAETVALARAAVGAAVARATRCAQARAALSAGSRGGGGCGWECEREAPLRLRRRDWEEACAAAERAAAEADGGADGAAAGAAGAGARGGVVVRQERVAICWGDGGAGGCARGSDDDGGSGSGSESDGGDGSAGGSRGRVAADGSARGRAHAAPSAAAAAEPGWSEVSGLEEARAALREAVELPVLHPLLFAALPLRPRSGVLLYGPPGCGKTLLAKALARATGLRIVTVKGPELLDKFIGASEAAVRGTFEAAAAAKPSILFLDEFDALAPRRGADSTGVTDRVVNQLLCQLDGIEALDGVAVLAATTRPDLIDPALLRPGRLDRRVYCGLPHAAARTDMLARALRGFELAPDAAARLGEIGELSAGFTGADMHALAYNVQLELLRGAADGEGGIGTLGSLDDGGSSEESASDGDSSDEEEGPEGEHGKADDDLSCAHQREGGAGVAEPARGGERAWLPPPWSPPASARQLTDMRAAGASEARAGLPKGLAIGARPASRQHQITHAHLLAALHATTPSLAPRELAVYERVYERFGA